MQIFTGNDLRSKKSTFWVSTTTRKDLKTDPKTQQVVE